MPSTAGFRCMGLVLLSAVIALVGYAPAAWGHAAAPGSAHALEHERLDAAEARGEARWRKLTPAQRTALSRAQREKRDRWAGRARASALPSEQGQWETQFTPTPVVGVHATMLPTGKVLMFSRDDPSKSNSASAFLWDPATRTSKLVPIPGNLDIWCGGQSLLADGRVLVAGGTIEANTQKGAKWVFTFDPWTETWTREPDMAQGRWYPTQTLLPDGRTLIVSGETEAGNDATGYSPINQDVEVFTPGAPGKGRITKLQNTSGFSSEFKGFYPHSFVMPDGGVRTVGPRVFESWMMRPNAAGTGFAWEDRPDSPTSKTRNYGTAVLLPGSTAGSTRILQTGGYDDSLGGVSVNSTELVDEAAPGVAPQNSAPLNVARSHHNTIVLPDTSLVTIGGGDGNPAGSPKGQWTARDVQKQIELWNPATGYWSLGPAQFYKRAYHSTAFLLPDGRVVSAGDEFKDPIAKDYTKDELEIYDPAYLFKGGERPVIDGMPAAVGYGHGLRVSTRNRDVAKAVLVAPAAVTHANDMNQRLVPLAISAGADGNGVSVVSPPNANVAPPGYYMLFLINASGKPSVAKFIRVGADVAPPTAGGGTPTPGSGTTPKATKKKSWVSISGVKVTRSRVTLKMKVTRASTVRLTASLKRTGSKRTQVLGRKQVKFRKAGRKTVVLKLSRTARRRLASKKATQLRLTATGRDRKRQTTRLLVTRRVKH